MAKGRKTGGRKPGGKNKRTLELEAKARAAADQISEALGNAAFDGDAHALLMTVYKDETQPIELRLDAAKAALRFEKPALASVDQKGLAPTNYVAYLPQPMSTPDDWLKAYEHLKLPPEQKTN
jgi:hypothetical protein